MVKDARQRLGTRAAQEFFGQGLFGAHLVAGVDQRIDGVRQQRGPVVGRRELFHRVHDAAGMDVGHPRGQRLRLGLAHGGAQRLDLAVDVGLGDVVQVDQRELGHAAARQRFRRPGPDAAEADDGDARRAQTGVAGVADQAAPAAEAALQVGGA